MNYLLRIKNIKAWKQARIKAFRAGVSMREVIERLINDWVRVRGKGEEN